jgi:hypothetical protein
MIPKSMRPRNKIKCSCSTDEPVKYPTFVEEKTTMTPKGKLFLMWHIGLGDAIICNGMVRTLLEKYQAIMLPVRPRNRPTVEFMFREMMKKENERIKVCPVMDDMDMNQQAKTWEGNGYEILKLGVHSGEKGFDKTGWDKRMYEQARIPFENRWKMFHVEREPGFEIKVGVEKYAFVHRDPERGLHMNIKNMPKIHIVEATHVGHLFRWAGAIEGATELHMIDSSVLCLADSLETKASVKVMHNYARNGLPPTLRDGWKII